MLSRPLRCAGASSSCVQRLRWNDGGPPALADFRALFRSDVFTILEESEPESEASTVPVGPAEEREEPDGGSAAGGNAAATPPDKAAATLPGKAAADLPNKDTPGVERVDLEASPEEATGRSQR